jgi:nucleoside-diphosphate-sugar epimerase
MCFSAVISGGSGKIGSQLIDELVKRKINVLSISRTLNKKDNYVTYVSIDLLDLTNIPQDLIDWSDENTKNEIVFFHLAWSGKNSLTDGSLSNQLQNIEILSNAISIAKKIGCNTFFNIGTAEEFFVNENLDNWQRKPTSLNNYGLSKTTAYRFGQILTYLRKIDIIHIRFSAVVNSLSGKFHDRGFFYKNMVKIINGEPTDQILSDQLFDFIETNELVNAIISLVGVGENKDEYYIGPNYPLRIEEFFKLIKMEIEGVDSSNYLNRNKFDYLLKPAIS